MSEGFTRREMIGASALAVTVASASRHIPTSRSLEAAGVQAALGGVDPEQVGTGRGVASVEQPLKGGDVGLRLVHA